MYELMVYRLLWLFIPLTIIQYLFSSLLANIPGKISRKTVAASYWRNELHEEMHELGIRDKWIFSQEHGELRGTERNALEYLEKLRCEMLYSH